MNHREPRLYPYDGSQTTWTPGPAATNIDYLANGYTYDATSHYYATPSHDLGNVNDMTGASGPYFRSMTPSIGHRYPLANRDPRYLPPHDFVSPSSSLGQVMYDQQPEQYPTQCLSMADQNPAHLNHPTQQTRFIPTPSQIAHAYSTYPQSMDGSPLHGDFYDSSALDYPPTAHMTPPSSIHRRPSRSMTGRPRGGSVVANSNTSPTSTASSPSGERFPCENCGKTFSRSHDRKRHYETQHLPSPIIHRCVYCHREFSRADSLKRHSDNGCDEMRP